ncbi:YbaB/EbfC family nucleoid-associated protein [Nocardia inohanensis]|uniref:YbaB/EbfC family nucleoid-associated protein n=1 Tax=Nocardia inohanensis TaxID=209246 RepID=UPI000830B2E8|nr:YbaB/EbfC family nucleoid-associated protein [Nocardia inohanensis]
MREAGDAASILEEFQQQMRAIAEASRKRAQLTASASAAGGRVTVTVNADGIVIATRLSADAGDLSHDEIGAAVTTAAQKAAADVAQQTRELMRPLRDERARMPKLSELFEGMPDLQAQAPTIPPASLAPPKSRRVTESVELGPEFRNSVDYDRWRAENERGATNSGW